MLAGKLQSAATGINPVAWDLANAVYQGTPFSTYSVPSQPQSVFLKSDGLKMYVLAATTARVEEYTLTTAWDITTASYIQDKIITQDTTFTGLFFKPDGLKMYVTGSGNDSVYEYNLSTAWDINTVSYLRTFSVATQDTKPESIFFRSDGLKMYNVGYNSRVYEWDLSTAWNISTASFVQFFYVGAQSLIPIGMFFRADGLKMYVLDSISDSVFEYDLSTAWDISTASYLQGLAAPTGAGNPTNPTGVFFKPDGLKMYWSDNGIPKIYQFDLTTAWDVTTASYIFPPTTDYFSLAAFETKPGASFFKPDGQKMYIIGDTNNRIYEYDLSTAWDISTASILQFIGVGSQESQPRGIFFKPDGLKMYIIGLSDDVNEYDLSTAWDISTLSFVRLFSVATQDPSPTGVSFKPDGLKMYVLGYFNDSVYEYNLSTAWNVGTASYLRAFYVGTQDGAPFGFFLKPDGLKMYVTGLINTSVFEYDLSTAWNISTASYLQSFSVKQQSTNPQSVFFKPDGLQMYVVDQFTPASIWAYNFV